MKLSIFLYQRECCKIPNLSHTVYGATANNQLAINQLITISPGVLLCTFRVDCLLVVGYGSKVTNHVHCPQPVCMPMLPWQCVYLQQPQVLHGSNTSPSPFSLIVFSLWSFLIFLLLLCALVYVCNMCLRYEFLFLAHVLVAWKVHFLFSHSLWVQWMKHNDTGAWGICSL